MAKGGHRLPSFLPSFTAEGGNTFIPVAQVPPAEDDCAFGEREST